ncbi:MAG: DUF512 domain-containing protein [Caloramator sp.]|nr:DUF512 domain-containing protein [Caloramator sp.]
MKKEGLVIKDVTFNSIAQEVGIEAGDILLKINGVKVKDILEYKFLIADDFLNLVIKKNYGEEWEIEIEKDYDEDLGLEIIDPALEHPKRCHNKCIFCFIDQLPPNLRETLYFKDDDSMLSFLQGNFITLTNLKDEELDRIIKYRISPINVSVHTTNPTLRVKMLNNKRAAEINRQLKKLAEGGISINCQIVLCYGINDKEELINTLEDLKRLYPNVQNVAIVPVGITKYRENLYNIEGYDARKSLELIEYLKPLQEKYQRELGTPFARLADEFYVMAGVELPEYEHYGDFEQLEDGIGMIRFFERNIMEDLKALNFDGKGKRLAFITGESFFRYLDNISKLIAERFNLNIKVYKVYNEFFGEMITVAGLLTGKDIIKQLKNLIKEDYIVIPNNMLKADEDIFLDDISLSDLEKELNVKAIKVKYTGEDLLEKIKGEVI